MLRIRKMAVKDLPRVLEIEAASFSSPWSERTFRQEILRNRMARYMVVESEGQIIAYLGLWVVAREIHITNLAVDPVCRRQGIASFLLQHVEQLAGKARADLISLEVRESNWKARRLYKRMGFREEGIRPGYYQDNNENAIIMTRKCKGEMENEG